MKTTLRNFLRHTIICTIASNFSFAQESEKLQSLNQIRKEIERFSPIFKEEHILSKPSSIAIKQLKERVQIEVFLSPKEHFPQSLLHRRLSVLSLINQISETTNGQVQAVIHEIEEHDLLSSVAKDLGISSIFNYSLNQELSVQRHTRTLYFGAAVKGSRGKQIIPYFGTVASLENALIDSIMGSSSSLVKKSIGIFPTHALGPSKKKVALTSHAPGKEKEWQFVLAMKKRYEVRTISKDKDLKTEYDAMVVVQPSLLDDSGIDHLVSLVKSGIPTVIFEDPIPILQGNFLGTFDPPSSNPISKSVPLSKKPIARGDLSKLWKLLEVNFCQLSGGEQKLVLRDRYNPFPVIQKSSSFPDEFVYVGGFENAFGSLVVSKNIEHLLFNCSGFISPKKNSKLSFEPLVSSGDKTGFTQADTFWSKDSTGNRRGFNPSRTKVPGIGKQQVIAAKVTGKTKSSVSGRQISVIVVSDTDFMADAYYQMARRPVDPSFPLKVQNSSFALGLIDHMAKNQNRVRELGAKYENPKVLSELDGSIKRIREQYSRMMSQDQHLGVGEKTKIMSRLRRERDNLIATLQESPFSGSVRVFDHHGRLRIERNYLSGKPHGIWKRLDSTGKEVSSKKYVNENPTPNVFNMNEFRRQRSMHLQKQQAQAERIRKLFAE
jgi:ABC-2 type transport system permease protein